MNLNIKSQKLVNISKFEKLIELDEILDPGTWEEVIEKQFCENNFDSKEESQAALKSFTYQYNNTPRKILKDLTPNQLYESIGKRFSLINSLFEIETNANFEKVPVLMQAMTYIFKIKQSKSLTPIGHNSDITLACLQFAKLTVPFESSLKLTKDGERMVKDQCFHCLFLYLFESFMRHYDWNSSQYKYNSESFVDYAFLQNSATYLLYQLYCEGYSWFTPKQFAKSYINFFPDSLEYCLNRDELLATQELTTVIEERFLKIICLNFGLIEKKLNNRNEVIYKNSELFNKVFHFKRGGQKFKRGKLQAL